MAICDHSCVPATVNPRVSTVKTALQRSMWAVSAAVDPPTRSRTAALRDADRVALRYVAHLAIPGPDAGDRCHATFDGQIMTAHDVTAAQIRSALKSFQVTMVRS